jgi:hypothetical protein
MTTTKKNLEKLAEIITDETQLDHYVVYQNYSYALVRGDKKKQLEDRRIYTALTKTELYLAMSAYREGFRLGQTIRWERMDM